MVLVIIYLLGIVIFTVLLAKGDERDFLAFNNHELQRFMRMLFVVLIILTFVTPGYFLFSNAAYNAETPIMKIFDYAGISVLYLIFGVGAGFITYGVTKVIKWIWK